MTVDANRLSLLGQGAIGDRSIWFPAGTTPFVAWSRCRTVPWSPSTAAARSGCDGATIRMSHRDDRSTAGLPSAQRDRLGPAG